MRALGEMTLREPVSGSFAAYASRYLGPFAGYVTGWTFVFELAVVIIADTAAITTYMAFWFPGVPAWAWVAATILVVGLINFTHVGNFGEAEFWLTLVKVGAIVAMIFGGVILLFTGASTADAALVLVDVRNGVLPQTRRHLAVMALLGVPHVVVALNKMDAIAWDQGRFEEVAREVADIATRLGLGDVRIVPISALTGEGVVSTEPVGSEGVARWYAGPPLLTLLEDLDDAAAEIDRPLRLPVQLVIRPRTAEHPDYRGLGGRIASGRVAVGDEITVTPGGLTSVVTGIDTPAGSVQVAGAGESVTVRLRDELDVGRGSVLSTVASRPRAVQEISGTVCWLDERPASAGQRVLVKAGTRTTRGILTTVGDHWDVDSLTWVAPGAPVQLNDIARVELRLAEPVAVDDYLDDRATGAFLVIDPASGATLAAGLVGAALQPHRG